jgi:hypothetical protein
MAIGRTMDSPKEFLETEQLHWVHSPLIHGEYMTCMEMFGSGVRTSLTKNSTNTAPLIILYAIMALVMLFGEEVGVIMPDIVEVPVEGIVMHRIRTMH